MAPKGNSKAITKSCPSCSKHVAVACKNCPCGHIFFVARRSSALVSKMKEEADRSTRVSPHPPPEPTTSLRFQPGIRRTERVKRDKPDFYNASEYDKQKKPKSSRQRLAASVSEDRDDLLGEESDQAAGNKKGRGRRKRKRNLAGELIDDKKIEDDEAGPILPTHKQFCLGINLCEINRKLVAVNPIF